MDQEALESASPEPVKPRTGSTRGFVFADLRGYSQFVETNGASAAAQLLGRYRGLVRDAVAHSEGTEIQTEGDSFFVVFDSVSAAVRCGLEIAAAAAAGASSHAPIRVGIGIHAGEALETGDSYIGSGVNIAARICSQARPGEVLVSETVRALTRTVLDVHFEPRGRPPLKGIAERIPLYAVTGTRPVTKNRLLSRRRAVVAGGFMLAAVVVAGVGIAWMMSQQPRGLPPGDWKIGLVTTLSGFEAGDDIFVQIANATTLAQEDLNDDGGVYGRPISLTILDDQLDEFLPAEHTQTLVEDPWVVAMIGPLASGQAIHALPISHAAGLLHCSPTNTQPDLTKPRFGAEDLRGDHPERMSYIRIPPADDIQSKALATFAYVDLSVRSVLVIDDGGDGRDLAEVFATEFEELSGLVTSRTLNEGADAGGLLEPILNGSEPPGAVFFSGMRWTGGTAVRQAMVDLGHGDMPYLVWDSMLDGPGDDEGTYIGTVGVDLAQNTYASHAAPPDAKFAFVEAYRERFGTEPDEWSASAYACMEIFFEALRAAASPTQSAAQLREAARLYAVETGRSYETVVGNIAFDENGDNLRQFVGIYRVDPSAAGGAGDWALIKKQDYGPAP